MIEISTKFKQVGLACMLGVSLVGCGSSDSDSKTESAAPQEVTIEKSVSALVQAATGSALAGAEISISGQSFTTDASGAAQFKVKIPQTAKTVVVTFKKAGFITQSIEQKVDELAQLSANLLPVKQVMNVAKIEEAQVIQAAFMNAQIIIPANAFVVEGTNQPATGAVTVEFTPWDITGSDLNAMPANGVAVDAQGNPALLISAGMITATFSNAAGQKLQLKQGVTADIQMDLPLTSVNNQAMTVGTPIPMWYFDPKTGKWKEEGTPGQVVASQTSPTGLAVHATVSHFSTWNWDFKFENPGSVNVKCKSAASYVPCHITAKVELKDGSGLTKTSSIPAEGVDIVNMPTEGTIHWSAKDSTGTLIGSVTTQLPGDKNVVIDLGTPATNNKVQCVLENGTPVACHGKLNGNLDFSAPVEGASVLTGLKNVSELEWSAQSEPFETTTAVYQYTGTAISGINGAVVIKLNNSYKLYDKSVYEFLCNAIGQVSSCDVRVDGYYYKEVVNGISGDFTKTFTIPVGVKFKVYLPIPPKNTIDYLSLRAEAFIYKNGLKNRAQYEIPENDTSFEFNFSEDEWCTPWLQNNEPPADGNEYCWYDIPR